MLSLNCDGISDDLFHEGRELKLKGREEDIMLEKKHTHSDCELQTKKWREKLGVF